MNRPIKFRAWDKEKNKMETDVLVLSTTGVFLDSEDYSIMQFTGLLDKNGKEIYELDRMTKRYGVLAHGTIYECVFHNGAFGYYPVGRSVAEHFTPFANSVNWHSFEVVGNAYEGDI